MCITFPLIHPCLTFKALSPKMLFWHEENAEMCHTVMVHENKCKTFSWGLSTLKNCMTLISMLDHYPAGTYLAFLIQSFISCHTVNNLKGHSTFSKQRAPFVLFFSKGKQEIARVPLNWDLLKSHSHTHTTPPLPPPGKNHPT